MNHKPSAPTKGTVLLVEDERDTRELLSRAIERAGWRCVSTADPRAALDQAREAGFIDVAVTDVVLGGDDRAGLRLLSELRAAGIHAPVIVITAYADVEKVKTALNEGAAHLLEKPFRAPQLIEAIERARAATRSTHATPSSRCSRRRTSPPKSGRWPCTCSRD